MDKFFKIKGPEGIGHIGMVLISFEFYFGGCTLDFKK